MPRKVGPVGGHQPVFKLGGKIDKKSEGAGIKALKNAIIKTKEFSAEKKVPNAKVAARTTKAAFRIFQKANKPNV